MAENKVWWLTPILVVFGLLGILLVLGATGVAPFLYILRERPPAVSFRDDAPREWPGTGQSGRYLP